MNDGVAVSGMLMLMCVCSVQRLNSSCRLYDVTVDTLLPLLLLPPPLDVFGVAPAEAPT